MQTWIGQLFSGRSHSSEFNEMIEDYKSAAELVYRLHHEYYGGDATPIKDKSSLICCTLIVAANDAVKKLSILKRFINDHKG